MTDVSVVIPTRNRPEIFQRALRCAIDQTYPVSEIVVADNSTNDDTRDVIESFDDSRIVYLKPTQDFPITANWIRGIRAASSEWVKIIYDDDWIENTFVEKTIPYATDDRVMIHTGGKVYMESDSLYCAFAVDTTQPAHELLKRGQLGVSPGGALIKKTALNYGIEVMPMLDQVCIDSGIGPDVILLYAATTQIPNSWVHIPEVLAHYDGKHGSLTIRTLKENPTFLHDCYGKAFALLDRLYSGFKPDLT